MWSTASIMAFQYTSLVPSRNPNSQFWTRRYERGLRLTLIEVHLRHVRMTDTVPEFIWNSADMPGRNEFLFFRRTFSLETVPTSALIHLFADTRYRLWVNGSVAAYGPARFFPVHPEYDSVELTPWLKPGENHLLVEVNHRGASSYQAVPSRGGFIAWGRLKGKNGAIDLSTPGQWECLKADCWSSLSPAFSFAQGPTEMLDFPRRLQALASREIGQSPVILPRAHWGELHQRSIPPFSLKLQQPLEWEWSGRLKEEEERLSFHTVFSQFSQRNKKVRFAYAVLIHSPRRQDISFGLFWGPNYLNGEELKPQPEPLRGNRENYSLALHEGWNVLYGEPEVLQSGWGVQIAWPKKADLRVTTSSTASESGVTLLVSEAFPEEELAHKRSDIPASEKDLENLKSWLKETPLTFANAYPAREQAWDEPAVFPDHKPRLPIHFPLELEGNSTLVADFGREYLGHILLEVECELETVIDLAGDEVLRSDQCLRFYQSNPFVDGTDRFRVGPGTSILETYHPRGGRYIQATFRTQGAVKVKNLAVRAEQAAQEAYGSFECSDSFYNWVWRTGVHTLQASMTDAWIDPWREQGSYLGDTHVEFQAWRLCHDNLSMARRAIQSWAIGQGSNGQMNSVVPSHHPGGHPDFTLIWVLMLERYHALSGDRAFLEELWPHVERIWKGSFWSVDEDGLWSGQGVNLFVDWGAHKETISGPGNAALNAFRVGALDASSRLAFLLGKKQEGQQYEDQAKNLREVMVRVLRLPEGFFAANRGPALENRYFSLHVQALCLLFHIGPASQLLPIFLRKLDEELKNFEGLSMRGGHIDLYFMYYVIEMLTERRELAWVEKIIRGLWGVTYQYGGWAFWESYARGIKGVGSQCHGWACAPMLSLVHEGLGLRKEIYEGVESFTFEPALASLSWASGLYPHAKGGIRVAWQRTGDSITGTLEVPEGVAMKVPENNSFLNCLQKISVVRKSSFSASA